MSGPIFEFISFRILEFLGSWISISRDPNTLRFQVFEASSFWVFEVLRFPVFKFSSFWIFEFVIFRGLEFLSLGFFYVSRFRVLNFQIFEGLVFFLLSLLCWWLIFDRIDDWFGYIGFGIADAVEPKLKAAIHFKTRKMKQKRLQGFETHCLFENCQSFLGLAKCDVLVLGMRAPRKFNFWAQFFFSHFFRRKIENW